MERLRQGIYRNGINQKIAKKPKELLLGEEIAPGTFQDPLFYDIAHYFVRAGCVYSEWVGISIHHMVRMVLQEVETLEYKSIDEQSALVKAMVETERSDIILEKLVGMEEKGYLSLVVEADEWVYFPTPKLVKQIDSWQELTKKWSV